MKCNLSLLLAALAVSVTKAAEEAEATAAAQATDAAQATEAAWRRCNQDNCLRRIRGGYGGWPQPNVCQTDCSSYMVTTVTPTPPVYVLPLSPTLCKACTLHLSNADTDATGPPRLPSPSPRAPTRSGMTRRSRRPMPGASTCRPTARISAAATAGGTAVRALALGESIYLSHRIDTVCFLSDLLPDSVTTSTVYAPTPTSTVTATVTARSCSGGKTWCRGQCKDCNTDHDNCGKCGNSVSPPLLSPVPSSSLRPETDRG